MAIVSPHRYPWCCWINAVLLPLCFYGRKKDIICIHFRRNSAQGYRSKSDHREHRNYFHLWNAGLLNTKQKVLSTPTHCLPPDQPPPLPIALRVVPSCDLFDIFESVPRRVCGEWCRWPVWWWGDSLWSVGWTLQIIVIIRSCVWWIPWFVEHWSFFHLYLPPQLLVSSFRLHSLSSNINTG